MGRFINPIVQLGNDDFSGVGSGWQLYFYETGTTTPKDTYSDSALTTANANPVVADSAGRFSDIFMEAGTYKVVLKDDTDVEKWTADPVDGAVGVSGAVDEKTADYTVAVDDATKLLAVDATSGAITITLLAATTAGDGFEIAVKKTDSSTNAVTVDANGSETIDGSASAQSLSLQNQSVVLRCDGTGWQIVSASRVQSGDIDADTIIARHMADSALGFSMVNGTLEAAVAANALTVSIKTKAGTDPSASDPVLVMFRNATAATGDYSVISLTAATSVTVSSGSTLGATNGTAFKLWVVGFNDGGTFRLGVINCRSSLSVYPLGQNPVVSATAEGGAGGADSAQVFYAGATVTSKAYAILGYAIWESGLSTAGTWDAGPTTIRLFDPSVKLPGEVMQLAITASGSSATGTTTIPFDNTIPQSTEGDEYMTRAITPTSAAHLLQAEVVFHGSASTGAILTVALLQDSTANALAANSVSIGGAGQMGTVLVKKTQPAGTTSATTLKARAGLSTAGTTTFNGFGGTPIFGGVSASSLSVTEIVT